MIGDEYLEFDPCPCDDCLDYDHCDGWEARFCCSICRWQCEEPDCESCNPWDI